MRISGVNGTPRSALPARPVDQARRGDDLAPGGLDRGDRLARRQAGGDDVLDHQHARAGLERGSRGAARTRPRAARRTSPARPSARPISWPMITPPIAGETTASIASRTSAGSLAASASASRAARVRVHQHPRALQVARAAQPRREDEMAFEQRLGSAEFRQNLVVGHASASRRFAAGIGDAAAPRNPREMAATRRLRDWNVRPIRPPLSRAAQSRRCTTQPIRVG